MDNESRKLGRNEGDRRLDDHNAELSGSKSGYRYTRVSDDHASNPDAQQKKAEKDRAYRSRLERLLATDPAYAALYQETSDKVNEALATVADALAATSGRLDAAQDALGDLQDRAAMLVPGGERVYRDAEGNIFTEDGRQLTPNEAASVVFPEGAPSYEDYLARKHAVEREQRRLDKLREIEARLGGYRDRLDDPDNPPDAGELRDIDRNTKDAMNNIAPHHDDQRPVDGMPSTDVKLPPPGG